MSGEARAALADTGRGRRAGGPVRLSHPGKVLFPRDGVTKADLADFYAGVARPMLAFLRERPIVMARYPDGIAARRILQKNAPEHFPAWVRTAEVPKKDGCVRHVVCDSPRTLAYLADQACIEVHMFLSRLGHLTEPDQVVFDLDPPEQAGFGAVRDCALRLRHLLEDELGLPTFVKTTGGKGLHVHVPLRATEGFEAVRGFARQVGDLLAARYPDLLTTEQRKDKRGERIYLDAMRNAYAQTAVAPYSVRARPGAPVATPLSWDEVADAGLEPQRFTVATVPGRLAGQQPGPWAGIQRRRSTLARAGAALRRIS